MTPSSAMTVPDSASPPSTAPESSGNDNIQPFYVLHKASSRNPQRKCAAKWIDLSPSKPTVAKPQYGVHKAFQSVWSKIHSSIKDVLRDVKSNVFNEMHSWVCQSFLASTSSGVPTFAQATRSFPIVTDITAKQLFTGFVLIKDVEFVDDLLMFEELGLCLKSHGCHVANLSSVDFSTKNGVGGCLRSLLRQFLMVSLDVADVSFLASWYREHGNHNSPVVIIIDNMERCSRSVLSDFIHMLSEWVVKIPMILIMGVTTLDASSNVLHSLVLQQLCPSKFILASPVERMDAVVDVSLMRWDSGFCIGHKVAVFLRNYFLNQDGTLTSFIIALKMACAQHFSVEPLSFILGLLAEGDNEDFQGKRLTLSLQVESHIDGKLARGLTELMHSQKCWSTVVMCLYEAGKYNKVQLLDLFCEALGPDIYNSMTSDNQTRSGKGFEISSSSDHFMAGKNLRKGGPIHQAIQKVRDLPTASLFQLLKSWERCSMDVLEIHEKVKELQRMMKFEEGKSSKQDFTDLANGDFMKPVECVPCHEVVCFKDVEKLKLALIGDPRRRNSNQPSRFP